MLSCVVYVGRAVKAEGAVLVSIAASVRKSMPQVRNLDFFLVARSCLFIPVVVIVVKVTKAEVVAATVRSVIIGGHSFNQNQNLEQRCG